MKTAQWRFLLWKLASHEQDKEKRRILFKEIDRLSKPEPLKKLPHSYNRNVKAA